ncbi:MAG: hypothetical protein JSV35_06520 [Candidatus Bathyarchaeota archaeon]|nr:MAG: hypothetical protein JSV35_06520 [Candidatus Bathyarchaeota archaeon]
MKPQLPVFPLIAILATVVLLSISPLNIETVYADATLTISNDAGYIDVSGYYRVLGELENVGDQAVEGWVVTTMFYNSSDDLIHTKVLISSKSAPYAVLNTINPGRKAPFETVLEDTDLSSEVDHYSVTITLYNSVAAKPLGLTILANHSRVDAFGNMIINGTIRNTGTETAESVNIIATYYDAGGNVIALSFTNTEPSSMEPSQTLPFQTELASIGPYPIADIESYALEAESSQYALIPEFPSLLLLPFLILSSLIATRIHKKRSSR